MSVLESVTHSMPQECFGLLLPCCGRTLLELPRTDRIALPWFADEVTCRGTTQPTNLAARRSLSEARQTIALMIAGLPIRNLTPYELRELDAYEQAIWQVAKHEM